MSSKCVEDTQIPISSFVVLSPLNGESETGERAGKWIDQGVFCDSKSGDGIGETRLSGPCSANGRWAGGGGGAVTTMYHTICNEPGELGNVYGMYVMYQYVCSNRRHLDHCKNVRNVIRCRVSVGQGGVDFNSLDGPTCTYVAAYAYKYSYTSLVRHPTASDAHKLSKN